MGVETMDDLYHLAGLCVLWDFRELLDHALGWQDSQYKFNAKVLHHWLWHLRAPAERRCPGDTGRSFVSSLLYLINPVRVCTQQTFPHYHEGAR